MEEFQHIILSWQHWSFEAISDLAFAVPAYVVGRWSVRRHDRRVHGQ
jgi:hypothetical protein